MPSIDPWRGEVVHDCSPPVWTDSFAYTSVPFGYVLCVAWHKNGGKH